MFHVTNGQLSMFEEPEGPIIGEPVNYDHVLGDWTWVKEGEQSALLKIQPLGDCEVYFDSAVYGIEFCNWAWDEANQ